MDYTLSELRNKKGLTQRELAAQLHLSPSTIALYELGMRTPGLQNARRIAKYFGVPLDDIVFGPRAYDSQTTDEHAAFDMTGTD